MSTPLLFMKCSICFLWPIVTSIDFEIKVLVKKYGQKFTRTSMENALALAKTKNLYKNKSSD